MDNVKLLEALMQEDKNTSSEKFTNFVYGAMRFAVCSLLLDEVVALCGPRHERREEREYVRAGSAPGSVFLGTDSEAIKRPRVRRRRADGATEEVRLASYEAARDGAELREAIMRGLVAGVSTRDMTTVFPSSRRTSKSEVSRLWTKKAAHFVEQLRGRDLSQAPYVVLMLDGVVLNDGLTAVVALGITSGGEKHMLDFEIGSSESAETCSALTDRLVERGLALAARRPLAVLDGAKALRKAVRKHWPDAEIQTCLVHVARGIKAKLSLRRKPELERLFAGLRAACSLEAAEEACDALERFVGSHSAEGLNSLRDAREEMLTLFRLGVPDTFNRSLLSTNSIENSILNMRRVLGRVTRWQAKTEMALKWMSCAMLKAERGFRRIQGYCEMPALIEALNGHPPTEGQKQKPLIIRSSSPL
jgi:putative transposase